MSLVIEKQDLNNLKEKQRQEHKQRMKEIIEKHKIELEEAICLKNERHNSMMKELDEQLLVETVRLVKKRIHTKFLESCKLKYKKEEYFVITVHVHIKCNVNYKSSDQDYHSCIFCGFEFKLGL